MTVVHSGPAIVARELVRRSNVELYPADNGVDLLFFASCLPGAVVLVNLETEDLSKLSLLRQLWNLRCRYVVYGLRGVGQNEAKIYSNSLDIPNESTMLIAKLVDKISEEAIDGSQRPLRVPAL